MQIPVFAPWIPSRKWSSSIDGFLGSGDTLTASLTADVKQGQVMTNTITLHVSDANGQQGTDATIVFVKVGVYLPVVIKNR